MKKSTLTGFLAVALLMVVIAGCKKALFKFTIDFDQSVEFTIDTASAVGYMTFHSSTIQNELEDALDEYNKKTDKVKSVKITRATLDIISGGTFDIVSNMEGWISAPNLPEIK